MHRKTDNGVSWRGVLPVHADEGALLFGLKLSVPCLKRRFRDDRPPDPAFGFCKGEWFHRHAPAVSDYYSVIPPYTAGADQAFGVNRSIRWCSHCSI